jgi:MFS family permease
MENESQSTQENSRAEEIVVGGLLGTALIGIILLIFSRSLTVTAIIVWLLFGCGLGAMGGSLSRHVSPRTKHKLGEMLGLVFAVSILVYPIFGIAFLGWFLLLKGVEAILDYFNIADGLVVYNVNIVVVLTFLTGVYFIWDIFLRGRSKDGLVRKMDIEEIEALHLHDGVPFGHMIYEWEDFKSKIKPGDEIWFWSTPQWTWDSLVGRCGYVIVRNDRPTRHFMLTGMN